MSYYPPQGTYNQQPVMYSGSHRSHQTPYASNSAYYGQQPSYGGGNVVYVPSHGSSRHGRHHSSHAPQMVSGAQVITVPSSSGGHRHHRSHGRHHSSSGGHYRLSFGERVRRFFGFGPKHYKRKSNTGSWGFMGRSRRQRYTDARTGAEVDRKGRPVYRV